MSDSKSVSWIAVVGVTVSVLTFFYSRRDKAKEEQEKTTDSRPVLSIRQGQLLSREIDRYQDMAVAQLTLENNGNRVAANPSITLTQGAVLQDGFATEVRLADIPPNQVGKANTRVGFALRDYQARGQERFEGTIHYADKLDPSRQFEEHFCFETPYTIGINGMLTATRLPLVSYDPPEPMRPCSGLWLGPWRTSRR